MKKDSNSSPLFLSGEADPRLLKNRLTHSVINRETDEFPPINHNSSKNKNPLIEIIDESATPDDSDDNINTKQVEFMEDDVDNDMPPPLYDIHRSSSSLSMKSNTNKPSEAHSESQSESQSTVSLMETMMAEATKAQREKKAKKMDNERKRSGQSTFASGLKKGFLSSGKPSKKGAKVKSLSSVDRKTTTTKTTTQNQSVVKLDDKKEEKIYELDKNGNLVLVETSLEPPTLKAKQRKSKPNKYPLNEDIPYIKPTNNQVTSDSNNSLRLDEVQEAMKQNDPNTRLLHQLQNNVDKWATPEFMEQTISKNSILMKGMKNPKFTAALHKLQTNPRDTMNEMKHHPDFLKFVQEFMNVMGNHFIELSEHETKTTSVTETIRDSVNDKNGLNTNKNSDKASNSSHQNEKDLGPYVEETLKKIQENDFKKASIIDEDIVNTKTSSKPEKPMKTAPTKSKEEKNTEDQKLEKILEDKELTQILMDPQFQRVMQECNIPGKMRQFMNHPEYGYKLRKLIDAGLLKIAF